jgi:ABC-type glucose/galactose transport system permease subunit
MNLFEPGTCALVFSGFGILLSTFRVCDASSTMQWMSERHFGFVTCSVGGL